MAALVIGLALVACVALTLVALAALRRAIRPRPAAPRDCGDCRFMVPSARRFRGEVAEDEDGVVRYVCEQRWIEVAPGSPTCSLGKSRSATTSEPR